MALSSKIDCCTLNPVRLIMQKIRYLFSVSLHHLPGVATLIDCDAFWPLHLPNRTVCVGYLHSAGHVTPEGFETELFVGFCFSLNSSLFDLLVHLPGFKGCFLVFSACESR